MPTLVPKTIAKVRAIRLNKDIPAQHKGTWLLVHDDDRIEFMSHEQVVTQFNVQDVSAPADRPVVRAIPAKKRPYIRGGSFSCEVAGKTLIIQHGMVQALYGLYQLEGVAVRAARSHQIKRFVPDNVAENITARLVDCRQHGFAVSKPSGEGKSLLWTLTNEGRFIAQAFAKQVDKLAAE